MREKTTIISGKIYLCFEMNWKQLKYQKNRLLRAALAILLLFTVSFSHTYADTVRQAFQSEAFYSKNNNSERKAISYKGAIRFGVLDIKSGTGIVSSTDFSAVHTAQAKVKANQKHKEYCSFKSNVQFFRTESIPAFAEEIPIS
ncbi:hypothetical protein [Flavobacterium microcysteis]|nr:hypothetical protein [Flavobacterium microcysteis]